MPALLVSIGAPRLRRLGFPLAKTIPLAELRLYALLQRSDPDSAHARYNALVRRLVSFERATECAKWPAPIGYGDSCAPWEAKPKLTLDTLKPWRKPNGATHKIWTISAR